MASNTYRKTYNKSGQFYRAVYVEYADKYKNVPEFRILKTMYEKAHFICKHQLKLYFFNNHIFGKDKAVPAYKVCEDLLFPEYGNQAQFRDTVTRLLMEDKIPILSSTHGYFLAKDDAEFDEYCHRFESCIDAYKARIVVVENIQHRFPAVKRSGEYKKYLNKR